MPLLPCGLSVEEVQRLTAHMKLRSPVSEAISYREPRYHYGEDQKHVCDKMARDAALRYILSSDLRQVPRIQIGAALGVSHESVAKRIRLVHSQGSPGKPVGIIYRERFQRAKIQWSCRGASLVRSLCC